MCASNPRCLVRLAVTGHQSDWITGLVIPGIPFCPGTVAKNIDYMDRTSHHSAVFMFTEAGEESSLIIRLGLGESTSKLLVSISPEMHCVPLPLQIHCRILSSYFLAACSSEEYADLYR